MTRGSTSVFEQVETAYLQSVIDGSETIQDVIEHFGHTHWNSRKAFLKRCERDSIDLSDLRQRAKAKCVSGLRNFQPKYTLDEILVEHSPYKARGQVKVFLIRHGLLEDKCSECGNGTEWNGKSLVLVLDHINGVNDDYRIENLRFLCPNCNSQTDTFAGRNVRYCGCGLKISRWSKSGLCRLCNNKAQGVLQKSRSKRPPLEDLLEDRKTMGREAVGRKYGVSGNAVKKWERDYGILGTLPDGRRITSP